MQKYCILFEYTKIITTFAHMKTYNTGETDADLRREYNPEGSNLRKAQLRLLDMAVYLQATAKKLHYHMQVQLVQAEQELLKRHSEKKPKQTCLENKQ